MSRASGHHSRFLRPRAPCATGHFAAPARVWSLLATAAAASVTSFSILFILSYELEYLAGSAPGRAFGAQPPQNEFAFAKHPLAERGYGRPGHVIPVHVLDIAAAVADEMVMPHAFRIKSRRATLHGHFTHQTSLHQVAQIVINRSPGRARIDAVNSFEDLRRCGMPGLLHQERHDGVALRRAPQITARQGAFDRIGVHEQTCLDYI